MSTVNSVGEPYAGNPHVRFDEGPPARKTVVSTSDRPGSTLLTTVGLDEDKIRRYVRYQEENEQREENESRNYGLF
jgi:hypothetical protein